MKTAIPAVTVTNMSMHILILMSIPIPIPISMDTRRNMSIPMDSRKRQAAADAHQAADTAMSTGMTMSMVTVIRFRKSRIR